MAARFSGAEPQHVLEFGPGLVDAAERDQCAPERDVRRQIRRVAPETSATGRDCLFEPALPAISSASGRERNRRRVHLDPALQLIDSLSVRHVTISRRSEPHGRTVTVWFAEMDRPASSVTVSVSV